MKLSVSNLAFASIPKESAYKTVASYGASGVEIAPTIISDWDSLTLAVCEKEAGLLENFGLKVSSLQAIFFQKLDCQLLGDTTRYESFCNHIRFIGDICSIMGARVAVFGAPLSRIRGNYTRDQAIELGEKRLRKVGQILSATGTILGIEPVPTIYKCDFLTSYHDVIEIVKRVDSPNIRLHLDTGCVLLDGGDIKAAIKDGNEYLCHFHVAEPNLANFSMPNTPSHMNAAQALQSISYDDWISIEMKESGINPMEKVKEAINFVQLNYFGFQEK